MKINGSAVIISFVVVLACYAIAWALTQDQIWARVYDSGTQSLRVVNP